MHTLEEANDLILRRISELHEKTILGFLPLSEVEQASVLNLVRAALNGIPNFSIRQLLRTRTGASTYALMLARSISELPGGQFWPCVEEQLGLHLAPSEQLIISDEFLNACSRLGVLEGTIENVGFVRAAPLIFQAGILRYWRHSLADALRRTLQVLPAPDLDDEFIVARFVEALRDRITGQPTLKQMLGTPIGPLLVRRLVVAYLKTDDSGLPPHLREPMKAAFEGVARGALLRGPFLAFDPALEHVELVLPAQSSRIATPESWWSLEGRRYAARIESRIPVSEISKRQPVVRLQELLGTFEDQEFLVDTRIDENIPFRIFRRDTLRERRLDLSCSTCGLAAGDYLVVTAPDVHFGEDEGNVRRYQEYRVMRHFDLRPGDEPLRLSLGDRNWEVSCDLQSGVFVDREYGSSVRLETGELLHFGSSVGLMAYFPAHGEANPEFQLKVQCPEQHFLREGRLGSAEVKNRVYFFTENLRSALANLLSDLPPGIHRIELSIACAERRIAYRFWYWQGLERINESRGLVCSRLPENLDVSRSMGIVRGEANNLAFRADYHRPFIRLSVTLPLVDLELPRAGVQVILVSPGEDWEEEPSPGEPIVVSRDDKRVLRFRSGGFQQWEIRCGGALIGTLDSNRSGFVISLAGLCRDHRGSGQIVAEREDGKELKLLSFSMPLTASAPKYSQNHGMALEEWSFDLPEEDLFEVAAQLSDLSDVPDSNPSLLIVLTSATNGFENSHHEPVPGLSVTTQRFERSGAGHIRISVKWQTESLRNHLFLIDFLRRESAEGAWLPLRCVERQGYSSLRIVAAGSGLPEETATWWRLLRSARRSENLQQTGPRLVQAMETLRPEELDRGLEACRQLLGWKYPTSVWINCANWFQDLPVYLGRHRFNIHDDTAAIWWRQSVTELCEYIAVGQTPVVKQFLLGSQPHCLRIPPNCLTMPQGRLFASPVGRSLNLAAEIHAVGSLLAFVRQSYFTDLVDREAFHAFQRFPLVSAGRSETLGIFDLPEFLKGLYGKTDELSDLTARVEVESLLSPEHLLSCVRAVNRRCHLIGAIADASQHHVLANHARMIEMSHQNLDRWMPAVAARLGMTHQLRDPYAAESFVFWWTPPCLANRWGQKVTEIAWALAAIARLSANGRVNPSQFEKWLSDLFGAEDRIVRTGINVLLSLAPELFAFYVALFDLALSER